MELLQTHQSSRPSELLWIEYQPRMSQGITTLKAKQSFLKARYHRDRRLNGLRKMRESIQKFPPKSPHPSSISETIDPPEKRGVARSRDQHISNSKGGTSMPLSLPARVEDIFPSLSLRTHQGVNFYFDYYRHEGSRRWFPMGHGAMLKWLLQQALDQPLLLEVILSTSAYSYAIIKRTQGACSSLVRESVQDAFLIRSQVIQSLQHIITKPSELFSESVALVLSQLLVTEGLEANMEAVDAHVEGLKNVIRTLGGLDALGELTLTSIYCCDPIRGLMKQSPPEFAICRRWEKAALKPSLDRANEARARFPALGSRFFHSPLSKSIHPQLRTVLRSFQDIISIYESFLHVETETNSALVDHKFTLLLMHRLISLPFDYEISSLDDAIRLATLVYVFMRIWKFQGKPCIEYILLNLLQLIVENQLAHQHQQCAPDLLFWILFMGGFASQEFDCHELFVAQLKTSITELSLTEWGSALSILHGFFFVGRMGNDAARLFWGSVFN